MTTTGASRTGAELLHPALQDRRPERGDHLQPRQRQRHRRPALGDRRRLPRAGAPRRAARPATRTSRASLTSSTRRSSARRPAGPASTATARADRLRGRLRRLLRAEPRPAARSTGAPWPPTDTGSGHLWPVLDGERGEYDVAAAIDAAPSALLTAMRNMTSGQGLEPEQAWEDPDVAASPFGSGPDDGLDRLHGRPARRLGQPADLGAVRSTRGWRSTSARGATSRRPTIVTDRYVTHGMPGSLPLTVTSPAAARASTTATVTVTGTTAPGAHVDAEAVGATGGTAAIASTTADSSGNWSLSLPTGFGTHHDHRDRHARRAAPATRQLSVTERRAAGNAGARRHRPRRRRQRARARTPTRPRRDFHAGRVRPDRPEGQPGRRRTSTSRSRSATCVRRSAATFGAQLLDVYVRNPAATSTSTAARYPARELQHRAGRRLERAARGPGLRVADLGRCLGQPRWAPPSSSSTARARPRR